MSRPAALFRFTGRVARGRYLLVGLSLMLLKYGVDAIVYRLVVGGFWDPVTYLNPVYSLRMAAAPAADDLPPWYPVFLLLWGLLFAWIGTAYSVRRATDAGLSPRWGLYFFVPFFNYALILVLALCPSRATPPASRPDTERNVSLVALAGVVFLALCAVVYGVMVQMEGDYGVAAFVSLPLFYGAGLGYVLRRRATGSGMQTIGFAFMSSLVACAALLLFALEGVVCIAMAFPVVFAAVLVGTIIGSALALMGDTSRTASLGFVLALPVSAALDRALAPTPAREVVSTIEIDAPVEVVWKNVVSFSELPEPDSWLFETGIAFPLRARIEGSGVGAVRYCEFSTGAFVEPITVWDEPRRLAFDVLEQPVPMEEWSFYDDVRPPHLTTAFRSVRGEFRLTPLPGGRTRLEGSTWYLLELAPEVYWQVWADAIVHRIHERVLRHVEALSEPE